MPQFDRAVLQMKQMMFFKAWNPMRAEYSDLPGFEIE